MDEKCNFCLIANGRSQAAVIHEGPDIIAFMDSRPIRPGHVLVVPRVHKTDIFSLSPQEYLRVLGIAQGFAKTLQRVFRPKRVGMAVVGFDVPHPHVHLIPMLEYHDITSRSLFDGTLADVTLAELEVHAATVRADLSRTEPKHEQDT